MQIPQDGRSTSVITMDNNRRGNRKDDDAISQLQGMHCVSTFNKLANGYVMDDAKLGKMSAKANGITTTTNEVK